MRPSRRSRWVGSEIAVTLALASIAGVAVAAEAPEPGNATRIEAPPPKPGADGWYDAQPIDESFVVRLPARFQAFAEQGESESGAATNSVGVRAKSPAAFGGVTNYAATCIHQEGDERGPEERIRSVVDRWDHLGMMRFQRPVETGGVAGLEFEFADNVKVIRTRVYAPKTGVCTVVLSWRPFSKPSDADIDKYLDSFRFTKH